MRPGSLYEPPWISVFLDGTLVRTAAVDVASLVGGDGTAWVGFTSATGGGYERHDVLNWRFQGTAADSTIKAADSTHSTVDSSIATHHLPVCRTGRPPLRSSRWWSKKVQACTTSTCPAQLEWGAGVPNPTEAPVTISHATGRVCWDPRLRTSSGCNGPAGNGIIPGKDAESGSDFIAPNSPAGSLVGRTLNRRTWFTVNDRTGDSFKDNSGYFEFDVEVGRKP